MKKILLIALLSTSYSYSQCFVKMVSGEQHTIAIADDGTLWGWGSNSSGEAGISTSYPNHVNVPTQIGTANNWTDIACGSYHTLALNTDEELYSWGYNAYGQLGTGDYSIRTSPTLLSGAWKAIGTGYYHSFAISIEGGLFGTGSGDQGQLGDNTMSDYTQFTSVASGNDWKTITGGNLFSIALKNDGTMYATGNNGNGQFGNGTTVSSDFWISTTSITNWDRIDAGVDYTFGLTDAGALYSWGGNLFGQLGQNGTVQQIEPQPVSTNVIDFSAGYQSSIWTTTTNVYSAGRNGYYQAQTGTTNDVTSPNTWTNFNSPSIVTMGIFSSSVVDNDGLVTWGRNDRGICGNGNFNAVTTPTTVLNCATANITEGGVFDGVVYPNPAQNTLNIELSEASSIIISDINGKQLITSHTNNSHVINVTDLESGIYFINTDNGTTKRFIKI